LTHPIQYKHGLHEVERNLDLLKQAGLEEELDRPWPKINCKPDDELKIGELKRSLGLTRPIIALHPISAAEARNWLMDSWCRFIEVLPEGFDVVFIGVEADRTRLEEIQKGCRRKVVMTAGLFSLPVLASFLRQCRLLIGVNSGPAHVAAAVGTPVISLFSATDLAEQWGPRGPRVSLIQKKTECSPCQLKECPFENECMRRIGVDEVLSAAKRLLERNA
jgi:ADP-heptose:LPS heptosyltransferase